jgi:hypothetical protein
MEGRPRSHFRKPIASVCHVTPLCEHALFYTGAFSTSYFLLSAMDGKIEKHVCIKICVKLGKSLPKPLKMLREAFGEHSLTRTEVSEYNSHFKAGRVLVVDDENSGRPSTCKTIQYVEKIRELVHEDRSRTIHELADTVGTSYGV